jgi:DNA-nicking Smr family endonuclease
MTSGGPLLDLERDGELVSARASGVDKRTWRKLATGELLLSSSSLSGRFARLDLHGETSRIAEERVLRFIQSARADGQQVVAIVHGRGLHSGSDGPVLKDVVCRLLTEGPARDHVLALASAPARLGGPGVTLVLLRTKR